MICASPGDSIRHQSGDKPELLGNTISFLEQFQAMYAALPRRKFIPARTRIFLDYLTEQTRRQIEQALQACEVRNRV